MKKKLFRISYTETVYYTTTEIKAKNAEEARAIFDRKFANGEIEPNETESTSFDIEEIKG